MIRVIRSAERYRAEHEWLTSWHSFSFAEYYDPDNRLFGPLRVFNEDIIEPGRGFGMHPHRDMEIMTCVIDGVLEHQDSMGNKGTLEAGEVQCMSAGTGIFHSEYNHSQESPVHLLQIWFLPDAHGLAPSWEQKKFSPVDWRNRLLPVVSGTAVHAQALHMHQDATVYLSGLEAGASLCHSTDHSRMYCFVIDGQVSLNGECDLRAGDTARISDVWELTVASAEGAQCMLMDLA